MPLFRLFRLSFETVRFALGWAIGQISPAHSWLRSPQRLSLALARLGPSFIKFGQALSMHKELLPDAYIKALQSLQEHISPFPTEEAIREIEEGLGLPINQLFARFDNKPLAAASVAQVHTASPHNGREVIVEVRRVGIKDQIDRNMRALTMLAL
jgi:ubiquinone biosynthesis protein